MTKEFVRGVKAAAALADEYNGSTTHEYRLGDCILCKLNVVKRNKPRRNKRKVQNPTDAWLNGFAIALAEMHRLSGDSTGVREAAMTAGLTLSTAKKVGVIPFDLRELKRAGVK